MKRRAWLVTLALALVSLRARAIDPFEIQVYDATANEPGAPGLELHVNRVFSGLTTAASPELPQNHQSHFTLEPSLGLTPFWELGVLRDGAAGGRDVRLRRREAALEVRDAEGVAAAPATRGEPGGVAAPEHVRPQSLGGEIRPIVAWRTSAGSSR